MYKINTEDAYEDFAAIKECLVFVIIRLTQNTKMIQTNYSLEKWKIKPEGLQLKNLFDWSQRCINISQTTIVNKKKQNLWIEMLLQSI